MSGLKYVIFEDAEPVLEQTVNGIELYTVRHPRGSNSNPLLVYIPVPENIGTSGIELVKYMVVRTLVENFNVPPEEVWQQVDRAMASATRDSAAACSMFLDEHLAGYAINYGYFVGYPHPRVMELMLAVGQPWFDALKAWRDGCKQARREH